MLNEGSLNKIDIDFIQQKYSINARIRQYGGYSRLNKGKYILGPNEYICRCVDSYKICLYILGYELIKYLPSKSKQHYHSNDFYARVRKM